MADPLSITASIVGIASTGIQLSTTLYNYTETVINADKNIREIARDLSITSSVITELGTLLGQDDAAQLQCESALTTAREAVHGCEEVFKEIQKELNKSLDLEGNGKSPMSKLKRLKWPLVEPKLNVLQLRLERLKNTLVLMLNVVTYARKVTGNDGSSHCPANPDDQRRQIDRLILLNEQANARSHTLETVIRRIGLMHASTEPSKLMSDEKSSEQVSSGDEKNSREPLPAPTKAPAPVPASTVPAIDDSVVISCASSVSTSCICGYSTPPTEQGSFHISRNDLNECANQLRALLKVVEDARSLQDGAGSCEVIRESYRESLDTLHGFFPGELKRPSRLRRLFAKRPTRSHGIESLSPNSIAKRERSIHNNHLHIPITPLNLTIQPRTTLPPPYEKSLRT